MLGMETVAERMADDFVGHHSTMPSSRKTAQTVDAARCLEESAHASMMTSVPHPGKTTAAASSTGSRLCYALPGQNGRRGTRRPGSRLPTIRSRCAVARQESKCGSTSSSEL